MAHVHRAKNWVDIPTDKSISALTMLENVSNTAPDKVVLEDATSGRTITYEGLRTQVRRIAFWLTNTAGVNPGHVTMIICPSCVEYVEIAHACWWAGATISPVNYRLHPEETLKIVGLVQPDHILLHDSLRATADFLRDAGRKSGRIPNFIFFGSADQKPGRLSVPALDHASCPERSLQPLPQRDSRKTCAAIMVSSGTTGSPKAVMLSHYNLVASCLQLRAGKPSNWRSDQAEIVFLVMSHIYGTYVCVTMPAWLGSYVCIMERFDLKQYCQLMQDRRATLARVVPAIITAFARDPIIEKYQFPALEYFTSGGAPVPEDTVARLHARFPHIKMCQTYGCTELSGAISQSGPGPEFRPGSTAGQLIANVEMRVVGEDGKDIPVDSNVAGELFVRSPSRMMGYKGKQGIVTSDCLDDGWYRTGDLGYLDHNGSVVIVDRIKDVIKYKGFQIAPAELEEIILAHPAVQEVSVRGILSEEGSTEIPVAFVVPKKYPADRALEKSIMTHVRSRVSSYKQIRKVVILDQLPRNALGKVLKRDLKLPISSKL